MKHTILWIEDFDNGRSEVRKKPGTEKKTFENELFIFEERYRNQVALKRNFYEGLQYIFEHHGEFDCVILDIDMRKNFGSINRNDDIWKKFLELVDIPETIKEENGKMVGYVKEKTTVEHLQENAGYYLVILLLTMGFPKERILMFTAYGSQNHTDSRVEPWIKKFKQASLFPPIVIDKGYKREKDVHKELNKELMLKYKADSYYQLRMLVFEMANLVEESYKDLDTNDFNCNVQKKEKHLLPEMVIELYKNMANAFFIYEPNESNLQEFLYQTMKQFSEPFEAEFTQNDSEFRIAKLFRNWSSHSRFLEGEKMCPEYFVFLFLLESTLYIGKKFLNKDDLLKILKNCCVCADEELSFIINEVETYCWRICKNNQELKPVQVPYNLIEVLHALGNKKKIKYEYLWMAYISCCCNKKVRYEEKSVCVDYSLKEDLSEVNRFLMQYAYILYKKYSSEI